MAIFVDEDSDTRLARRGALQQLRRILAFFSHKMARATADRDMRERGRDMQSILRQYLTFVKPSFDEYIFPTKKYADIIFPRGKENQGMAARSLHAVFATAYFLSLCLQLRSTSSSNTSRMSCARARRAHPPSAKAGPWTIKRYRSRKYSTGLLVIMSFIFMESVSSNITTGALPWGTEEPGAFLTALRIVCGVRPTKGEKRVTKSTRGTQSRTETSREVSQTYYKL